MENHLVMALDWTKLAMQFDPTPLQDPSQHIQPDTIAPRQNRQYLHGQEWYVYFVSSLQVLACCNRVGTKGAVILCQLVSDLLGIGLPSEDELSV